MGEESGIRVVAPKEHGTSTLHQVQRASEFALGRGGARVTSPTASARTQQALRFYAENGGCHTCSHIYN
eukprot:scaffold37854_cov61-Phaeocystis_antarctica.AAC.6